jgi:hypothetical protein
LKALHTPQVAEFVEEYRRNWKEHVVRMSAGRILQKMLRYEPKGERSSGRPLKRRKDSVI